MPFYNTINAQGQILINYEVQCKNQTEIILHFFKSAPHKEFTPIEVHTALNAQGYPWPVTSIRRAITDLTKQGKLLMNTALKGERYGKPNHTWTLSALHCE